MSPREESILSHAESLAKSFLEKAMVGVSLNIKIKIETTDSITVTVEINIGG